MASPKKKLNAYRGSLSPAQIAEGMNAATQNALRLLHDAELLLAQERFPTATSLAILAIEEAGKTSQLRYLALSKSLEDIGEAWKGYRSHTKKNVKWILPDLAKQGARTLEDLRLVVDESSDHPFLLDQMKQLGFYTDCLGQARWATPDDSIPSDFAKSIVAIAKILVGARKSRHTTREIELWIEHVGPVWKKDMAWMKQALVNWHSAMQANGLYPEGDNEMETFVR